MSMDSSAMDSLSTTSDHSVASSNESPVISIKQQPLSPLSHNNSHNNNNNNTPTGINSTHHHTTNHHNSHSNNGSSHNNNHNNNNNNTSNNSSNHNNNNNSSSLLNNSTASNLHHYHHQAAHHHHHHQLHNRSPTPVSSPGRQPSSPLGTGAPQMMPMPHPLSPPQVSTPSSIASMGPRMAQSMPHLPPHGLGLLNSLQMMHHANPLELMAAAHHQMPPRSYNSPPPISTSDPTANECKLVDYRGQKVAAFIIAGDTMLCLPQAFELFLKHLVGGLHTVYTKLKRLDIVPLVCNVEQVRILRGLGAIQPGVNRCKLLSCKDFDVLYRDCTTASSRPGRPPKRGSIGLSLPASHLSHHPQLKKHRMDNGDYPYENGHLTDLSRLEKSPLLANGYNPPPTHLNHMQFMQMNHHHPSSMMSPGIPPHGMPRPDGSMMKGQPGMPGMDAIARSGIWENCRAAYEDIVKHLERLREERGEDRSMEIKARDYASHNGSPNGHSPVLNLSKSGGGGIGSASSVIDQGSTGEPSDRSEVHSPAGSVNHHIIERKRGSISGSGAGGGGGVGGQVGGNDCDDEDDDEDNVSDENVSEVDERDEKDEDVSDTERDLPPIPPPSAPLSNADHQQAINYSTLAATAAAVAASTVVSNPGSTVGIIRDTPSNPPSGHHHHQDQNLSSTETLLRNIQSLLKVAADNARQQERQITYEKAELKMDVLREREFKDSLERQLTDEQKLRSIYQRRFKKERKARIRIQHQLDMELKRRNQLEEALKSSGAPAEALRILSETNLSNERRRERSPSRDKGRADSPYASEREGRSSVVERSSERSGGRSERERDPSNTSVTSGGAPTSQSQSGGGGAGGGRSGEGGGGGNGGTMPGAGQQIEGNGGSGGKQPWNYPGLDLMASGAFWQNYSESLAQELELERKARQQSSERDVKSPLQDRQNYYKNSVLYSNAT